MLELVVEGGRARGIITRNLENGKIEAHSGDAVILATGGYCNVYFLSTNAVGCNVTATYRAYKKGAAFANPCYTQIHPTCIPVSGDHQSKLTLMSESLRNDGRIWVPLQGRRQTPSQRHSRQAIAIITWSENIRATATWPRAISPRGRPRKPATRAAASGPAAAASTSISPTPSRRLGKDKVEEKYGNLFEMYERITGENGYQQPMRIYPALHYTMGGLWVDYNLMSNIPGLFVLGEANFSDHGANRLGASALMQGLADGYFVIPYTLGNYFRFHQARSPGHRSCGIQERPSPTWPQRTSKLLVDQGQEDRGRIAPRTGQGDVGKLRHGPHQAKPRS